MVKSSPPSPLRSEDYNAIQDAVMETERGRWFLREFALRNRNADTEVLLSAIQKLHDNLVSEQKAPDAQRITLDLADMANAIAETKKQIAAMGPEDGEDDKVTIASNELDAIVHTAEKATGDILNTAEQVQEMAWNLRELGVDAESCDTLDQYATDIYTACSFQDLTGQRTEKVIKVLQFIENRVLAMMDIWQIDDPEDEHHIEAFDGLDNRPDAHLLNGPQLEDNATSQGDIDDMMSDDMFDKSAAETAPDVVLDVEVPTLLENEFDDIVVIDDQINFDISDPEILEIVDVPSDPSKPEEDCIPAYVLDNEPEKPNLATEPRAYAETEDDEFIEIGTSDEFAGISSEKEISNSLYSPDGQLELEDANTPAAPDSMNDYTADLSADTSPQSDHMMAPQSVKETAITETELPTSAVEMPTETKVSMEQVLDEKFESAAKAFSDSILEQADKAINSVEAGVEYSVEADNHNEGDTSLSALSPQERQIIFS